MTPAASLHTIRTIHTLVWAFFAGCIIVIPVFAILSQYRLAFMFICVVLVEVLILIANRLRCPLTGIAARYTTDRRDNFDIYLPLWVARHNKSIFGWLYVVGGLLTFVKWIGWLG